MLKYAILAGVLFLGSHNENKVDYFNKEVRQVPDTSLPFNVHPQYFYEEFLIPFNLDTTRVRLDVSIDTKTTKGAGNLTAKDGWLSIFNVLNYSNVSLETTGGPGLGFRLNSKYDDWDVLVPGNSTVNGPVDYDIDIGSLDVSDISNLKLYNVNGVNHIKVIVTGNSFYETQSLLFYYMTLNRYDHIINGQLIQFT